MGALYPAIPRRVAAGCPAVDGGVQRHGVLEVIGDTGGPKKIDVHVGAQPLGQGVGTDKGDILGGGHNDNRAFAVRVA